jgi:hypothetical protein
MLGMKTENVSPTVLDLIDQRRIAVEAEVDVRTLQRALAGERIKPLSRYRIARTLTARGLIGLLPNKS